MYCQEGKHKGGGGAQNVDPCLHLAAEKICYQFKLDPKFQSIQKYVSCYKKELTIKIKLPQFTNKLQTHADSVIGMIIGARDAISESSNRS